MARISKEQRSYIESEFFKAVHQKANDSVPKALLKKKAIIQSTTTYEITLKLGSPGRYHCLPRMDDEQRGKATTMPNPTLKQFETAVAKANKIVDKGHELWKQIEAEMILGSDDIKKVLADALAKVAKL